MGYEVFCLTEIFYRRINFFIYPNRRKDIGHKGKKGDIYSHFFLLTRDEIFIKNKIQVPSSPDNKME
jgi:hypothetical protein